MLDAEILQNDLVRKMFLDSADQDYILARVAFCHKMFRNFFWCSGQAIEKYLKASLLLNGHSSIKSATGKNYGHDLSLLYANVSNYSSDFLPKNLKMPVQLREEHWRDETPSEFLSRIEADVSTDARYNVFGHDYRREDIFHLDQLIFSLRRVAVPLDAWPFLGLPDVSGDHPKTYREFLERFDTYMPNGKFEEMTKAGEGNELRRSALNTNFPFASSDFDHSFDGVWFGTSWSESPLATRILRISERDCVTSEDKNVIQLANWALQNIKMNPAVIKQLKKAAEKIKARNGTENTD